MRIDRWLFVARLYKSRTLAAEACTGGHVTLNGNTVKPSHVVRVGDTVAGRAPRGAIRLVIAALSAQRLAPTPARALYDDQSPPRQDNRDAFEGRPRGAGRPTKAERRATSRLKLREMD
jgi:ribosome-associated heat shock protein Hsp15